MLKQGLNSEKLIVQNMPEYVVVAPMGDNPDALFVGIRHFPTKKIILLYQAAQKNDLNKLRQELARFQIPVEAYELKGDPIESAFEFLANLKKIEGEERLLVNVSTGDRITTCAILSACYVTGVRAFGIMDNEPRLLPMLRFSYTKMISESKMKILRALMEGSVNLESLAEKVKMSPPLVSYHFNGDRDSFGLIELGLVETVDQGREKIAQLGAMGRLFAKGYL